MEREQIRPWKTPEVTHQVDRHTEAVTLKQIAAGAALHQQQGAPKAAQMTSADPLALLERVVAKQQALQHHRGLVRERRAFRREAAYRVR